MFYLCITSDTVLGKHTIYMVLSVRACVRVCVCARARVCVRACVRVCRYCVLTTPFKIVLW